MKWPDSASVGPPQDHTVATKGVMKWPDSASVGPPQDHTVATKGVMKSLRLPPATQ